ncbi:MAG: glycosyltransferase [Pseudomonadota bacterium]
MTPKCSVLLPFRNAQSTLAACLASIVEQTERDIEIVAVDDRSDDASRAVVERVAASDSRIHLINNAGSGLVAALETGRSACRSDLIARMDADDVMRPERLKDQIRFFAAHPHATLVGSRVELLETDATGDGQREYVRWQNACVSESDLRLQRFVESPFAHPSVTFRNEAVQNVGGYRDGRFPEDYDLWLRLWARGHRLLKIDRVLLDWRDGADRVSRIDPRCSRSAFDKLRARRLAEHLAEMNRQDDVVVWGAGRRTRQRVRHLQREGVVVQAWIDIDPRKIGNVIDGARVHAPDALNDWRRPFVLSYVANHGARAEIGAALGRLGFREGADWLSVG